MFLHSRMSSSGKHHIFTEIFAQNIKNFFQVDKEYMIGTKSLLNSKALPREGVKVFFNNKLNDEY